MTGSPGSAPARPTSPTPRVPISEEEIAECEAAGIEYVELHIATDGLTVLTSPENEAVTCLAFTDLYALLGPESEGFANWSDANELAAELGAPNAPYPEEPLVITAPGEESGTYDTFVEFVIADISEERLGEDNDFTRADYNASANDNVIVQGITDNPTSLGWVGFAFYEANEDVLKAIEVDNGESGCVARRLRRSPAFEYPSPGRCSFTSRSNDLANRPELSAFVDYYLSDEGLAAVADAGYVAAAGRRHRSNSHRLDRRDGRAEPTDRGPGHGRAPDPYPLTGDEWP